MLLDTYAWVEFFKGSDRGRKVRKILKERICYTSVVSLAETVEWALKNKLEKKITHFIKGITKASVILELDEEIAVLAGKINYDRKKKVKGWGMVDSLILSTVISYNINILTGDRHFKNVPNAVML